MADQPGKTVGLLSLPKPIVLIAMAGISCFVVWSFNSTNLLGFLASLLVGSFLGCLAGGLVGVHLFSALATMVTFGAIVEGSVLGNTCYGWGGAILGGLIGIVAAFCLVVLPMMLIQVIMIFGCMYPFTSYGVCEEKQKEAL